MNLWTIAADQDFLAELASAVASGQLLENASPASLALSDWTILVPTRRAARALANVFLQQSGKVATLLPRIRPLGDIDEESLADSVEMDGVLPALSSSALTHLLLDLLKTWAERNPQASLAAEILASPQQSLQLALSLRDLLAQLHTEEIDLDSLRDAYDLDLAGHRAAILDLLQLLSKDVPQRLHRMQVMTAAQRRNMLLRLEAERIAAGHHQGPVVAAGSTGTNPATRELLRAIALKHNGAVVLPGFDTSLDDKAWDAISPEHPQAAMKALLSFFAVDRASIKLLGRDVHPRLKLLSEVMLPAAASEAWQSSSVSQQAFAGIHLCEAQDRHEEALAIALRFKHHLAQSQGPAALITPDRELARRVKLALQRWNIAIDESGGEPLADQPLGVVLSLLIRARTADFASQRFLALLHHPLVTFGMEAADLAHLKALLDITCFRGMPESSVALELGRRLAAARNAAAGPYAHPALQRLSEGDWDALSILAERIAAVLGVVDKRRHSFAHHVKDLEDQLTAIAPEAMADGNSANDLRLLLQALHDDRCWTSPISFEEFAPVMLHHLAAVPVRPPLDANTQLSILGLLEARLVPLELAVLGGLNEGKWPQAADSGPWLNRSMRGLLGLSQPEREIGVTAHDFSQGLARREVMVTWSRRIEGKPALPSRWILRLRALLEMAGLEREKQPASEYVLLARRFDRPEAFSPQQRPAVRPPVPSRPRQFSVTEVEKLVRDSYAVFARRILALVPLEETSEEPDGRLRGNLVHEALQLWMQEPFSANDTSNLARLLACGEECFAPYMAMPEISKLWWPRFVRMARALIPIERSLQNNLLSTHSERRGVLEFSSAGTVHRLTARADRIDVLVNGRLRLFDYKTGAVPTLKQVKAGFSPQLTLEKIIAEQGRFEGLEPAFVAEAAYFDVGGGKDAVQLKTLADKEFELNQVSEQHYAALQRLMAHFQQPDAAYVPRHHMTTENEASDYDHLSRWREWQLTGSENR